MRPEKYVFLENGEKPCDKFESFYDCYEKYYAKKSFDNCTKCMRITVERVQQRQLQDVEMTSRRLKTQFYRDIL